MGVLATLLAAAAAVSTGQPAAGPATARSQATAMIRIVQAEQIRFAEIERHEPQRLRMSSAQLGDGSRESLRIVEFE